MKVKVSELSGIVLDYAVAICEGGSDFRFDSVATYWITINGKDRALSSAWSPSQSFTPSTNWLQCGKIIEREHISLLWLADKWGAGCNAWTNSYGSTPLEAAMRCYVAFKYGDEIEIPNALK